MSSRRGLRAFTQRRWTRPGVSSPASVVRSISSTALTSQAACQSFLTVRLPGREAMRRSAALRLICAPRIGSSDRAMPSLRGRALWRSWASTFIAGVSRLAGRSFTPARGSNPRALAMRGGRCAAAAHSNAPPIGLLRFAGSLDRGSRCCQALAVAKISVSGPMPSVDATFDLTAAIRSIPDYPKPGIVFRDITTLLGNARAFRRTVDELVQPWAGMKIDKVAGIEARGFILGGAVAHQVSAGFIPIRKKGKLPHKRVSIAYSLEYGLDEMEMHEDAVERGERVVLVDDLIATGGTAEGAVKLLRNMGAEVLAACFIIDLPDLGGAEKLRKLDVPVRTLISFGGH